MKLIKLLPLIFVLTFAKVNLNFQNLDINDFIRMVAKITDKNILITQPLVGKVNFVSVKPVSESEVYDILLSVLKSKGYTIIKDGNVLKVVRSSEAIKEAPPLNSKFYEIQTAIIPLHNISARDAYTLVNYLVSRYGKIVLNIPKNLLIVTDYPKNIKLIKEIIAKIDNQKAKDVKFIHLKYTDAANIYGKIKDIANGIFDNKIYQYKIIADENSNTLIIVGEKRVVNKLYSIAKNLDIRPKPTNQITQVITLKNSDVTNVAKVLQNIIKVKFKKNPPSITAAKETNSLIIVGDLKQIQMLKMVISALDIPKQQVYVKAKILEISNSKASQIGAKFGIYAGSGENGLYTLSANLGGPAVAFNVADLGLAIPTLKQGIALGATLDLLETLGAAKKLSEPSILCINNTPSTIYVGKTVSVLTGKTTSTVTSESYTRQDIGLTLKITPRIDSDNKVSLKVESVIEDILPGSVVGLPTTSKREIKTTTIVNNGQSIIIGGLVKDNKDITIKKVPLLGDIPIIGAIFRHKEVNNDKTTLAIILTPYIIKKSSDLDKLRMTLSKLNALEKKFVKEYIKKHKITIKKPKKQITYDPANGYDYEER
ncbi:secretin N-terminal domain-containing protein [Caminibacter pacificus]|uniref:General secretion pathway protein D n=1 Tax=Caminibacter pacificus TaxID=1424653 RepID=A0AAJ4RB63_9BACT|nr:secretin N-terminal domain-containing protein [Caminibacter pacificus]QCI27410.1 type II and III secretion system protein:NolW [Caminibacter pacificus]ROR38847.1 general secretion pathway protein D [Caminibacter pacificus]